ncbi:MAG: transketolase C-terminal domain-containing protein [Halobacteriales archaeon]
MSNAAAEPEPDEQAEGEARIMTGTGAIARAVRDVNVDAVAAYPITPQTEIVEGIAEYVETGELDAAFSRVESEHSALSSVMGAAQANARTFTATASQGLLYMSEMVWWTAGSRLPVVMAIANRALGPPWNIWGSHTDALSQRDSGWIQLFASDVQEAYDLMLAGYRIAEDSDVMLPMMVNLDGFTLAHTMQPLRTVPRPAISDYLGEPAVPHAIDVDAPRGYGAFTAGDNFWKFRRKMMDAMERVPDVTREAFAELEDVTGREYDLVHEYRTDDADVAIVGLGTLAHEAEVAADLLREEGTAAGVVRPQLYTPFPEEEVRTAVADAEKVVVLDRSTSFGRDGIVTREVDRAIDQDAAGVIAGIGGQNVAYDDIVRIVGGATPGETVWFGGEIE